MICGRAEVFFFLIYIIKFLRLRKNYVKIYANDDSIYYSSG